MDDSFKVRVDKVFGSLEASSSNSNSYPSSSISSSTINTNTNTNLPSLWSLTDDEIERREWNRDKGCPDDEEGPVVVSLPDTRSKVDRLLAKYQMQPSSSSLQDLQAHIQELLNESDDEGSEDEEIQQLASSSIRQLEKPDDHNDDEWDVRASVGLDSTLDFEDEEDADDQVAIGEEAGDLYRKEITDYEGDMDSSHELPKTFRDVKKDPRANHVAAQRRIKEDSKAAADLNEILGDAYGLKSNLINRDNRLVMKSEKRVMFEPEFQYDIGQDPEQNIIAMDECTASEIASFHAQGFPNVPDYVRNPSKYTHYTFDSSTDVSEETNKTAYMDFLNLLKGPKATETQDGEAKYLLNSVTFTPKKKAVDSLMTNETCSKKDEGDGNKENMCIPLGIAAEDAQDIESCAMEEDEPEIAVDKSANLPKADRRYRTKAGFNLDDPVA